MWLHPEAEDLANRLEAHFGEEERQLANALDAIGPTPVRGCVVECVWA
ncbi:hypothetical protein [Streptomyces sp. x-19]